VSARLFHFEVEASSASILAEMKARGYRPATLQELIALDLVTKIPKYQSHPIVALGSVANCSSGLGVVFLNNNYLGHYLDIAWYNGDWEPNYYFLAIKKKYFKPVKVKENGNN